jgi:methionine-gamma-lyase
VRDSTRREVCFLLLFLLAKNVERIEESMNEKGALTPPIYQTSTFVFPDAETGEARFAGDQAGYVYTRIGNPTLTLFEEKMAELEGAEAALAFGSGMAAVSAVLIGLVKSGDHILCSEGLYGCTYGLLNMLREKFDVQFTLVDMTNREQVEQAIRPETKVCYIETPINPTIKLVNLKALSKLAKQHGMTTVVDNTLLSPHFQRPLQLGCDVVLHSATKYIGGHGDVIAGVLCGKQELIDQIRMTTLKDIGGVLSPFDAWLLIRGLKTLGVRMDRHAQSALDVAKFLEGLDQVSHVYYPELPSFAQYELGKEQMQGAGGVLSFHIKGGKREAQAFINRLKLIKIAVSLGDAETLVQHPATMTHAVVPEEERKQMGITDSLIRLSIGLEDVEEIKNDLKKAL